MKRRVIGIALFCLVLLAAIFAGYWDMLNTEKLRIASEEATSRSADVKALAESKPRTETSGSAAVPTAEPKAEPAPAPAPMAPDAVAPTFDVLRVEPDGSTVMAGKAAAGATVRLTDGTTVLGEDKVGPGGDFAIVLDNPLPVGEHQIRIEAKGADGAASTSKETAIVSVPEPGRENELLAMVETPEKPSRLISVPKAEPQPPVSSTSSSPAPAVNSPGPAASPGSAAPSGEDASASAPAGMADPSAPPAPGSGEVPAARPQTETPLAPAPSAGQGGAANLVGDGALAVEAVEIEDETIYVAGRAPAGSTIRVYVDNVFLAEDGDRRTDRFLVSTTSTVAPGEHMVRADQVASDGTVVARVEVPFVKPEGRSMSAVAGADPAPSTPAADARTAPSPASGPASSEPSKTATSSSGELAGETASGMPQTRPQTAGDAMDVGPQAVEPGSLSGAAVPETAASGASPPAAPAETASRETPSSDPAAEPSSPGSSVSSPADSEGGPDVASSGGSDVAAARQAPLQAAGARVIIRRGDTLWRISREVYGRGARYTTIYLANGDQIRDPDRIYPGQVFRMPETPSP